MKRQPTDHHQNHNLGNESRCNLAHIDVLVHEHNRTKIDDESQQLGN